MTTKRQSGSLYTHIQNNIATIEFGHPASNSFTSELLERLSNKIIEVGNNNEVSVVVLKAEDNGAFCAGASLDELLTINNFNEAEQFFLGFARVINSMRVCGKVIIGRVQGKVVGGGLGLVSVCDYVLATELASVKLSELTIGIGPYVIEPSVSRKIGIAAFAELTLEANLWKSAYWAKEKGLYNRVFETTKGLDKEIEVLSENLASYNYNSLIEIKKAFWRGTENWDDLLAKRATISSKLVLSDFTKKALKKFKK